MSDVEQLYPHRRYNPLKDQWVLVSPHRFIRPWNGRTESEGNHEKTKITNILNPLLPGARRTHDQQNPNYTSTFVFDNDYPGLNFDTVNPKTGYGSDIEDELFVAKPATGKCRVMCYSPDPHAMLWKMTHGEIVAIIKQWGAESKKLIGEGYEWIQIFENKGAAVGSSNPHPHCQIWACNFLPTEPAVKDRTQKAFYEKHSKPMLMHYAKIEMDRRERIVLENDHWLLVVPYWAVWPYETLLLPKRHLLRVQDLTCDEIDSLAVIIKQLMIKYDNIFKCPFPYSMLIFQAPGGSHAEKDQSHWQFHMSWLPPLLKSPTERKFMGGFEQSSEPLRDLTPEKAVEVLNLLSNVHYTEENNVQVNNVAVVDKNQNVVVPSKAIINGFGRAICRELLTIEAEALEERSKIQLRKLQSL